MKTMIALTALTAATVALAGQADAFKLSPAGKWTATGPTNLTANGSSISCTSNFGGTISSKGAGKVTSFSATGSNPACSLVQATLPWKAKAISATQIKFSNVAVGIPAAGISCGPGSIVATDNGSGAITFNSTLNPGNCQVSGTVQSTPPVVIVP